MVKIRVGNRQNSILNGEWAGHVRRWGKRVTAGIRRSRDKKVIHDEMKSAYDPTSIDSFFI